MRVSSKTLSSILTDLAATKQRRRAFGRVMEVRPGSLSLLIGNWYDRIEPWKKNVDEFDRRLLGILGERRIGLHFSSADWQMSVEQDPFLDALRAGEYGELHYYAIDPEAGAPKFLKQFPMWGNRGRNYLIVIDREQAAVKQIEGAEENPNPLRHIIIKARPSSPVYARSNWQRELAGDEAANFYLMLFSVANGFTLLDALKAPT